MKTFKNSFLLLLLFLLLPGGLAWSQAGAAESLGLLIGTDRLETAMAEQSSGLLVIDFGRTKAEYQRAHIPGAVYLAKSEVLETRDAIPNMLPDLKILVDTLESVGLSNASRVVIYDQNTGRQAARLFWTLEYLGHERVALLDGGFDRWLDRELPVRSGIETVRRGSFLPSPMPERLASMSWIKENYEKPEVALVDARSLGEYTGAIPRARRNGHIPGALRIEWSKDLNRDNTFLRRDELEQLYRSVGAKNREVVAYCQTGQRAAHTYFALRLLGYRKVRLYDASWAEWGNQEDTPITKGRDPG